jgi:hypothetical protein
MPRGQAVADLELIEVDWLYQAGLAAAKSWTDCINLAWRQLWCPARTWTDLMRSALLWRSSRGPNATLAEAWT